MILMNPLTLAAGLIFICLGVAVLLMLGLTKGPRKKNKR